ncbi:family 43 glycosylhydrolase [Halogeometricum sp. S1BR25-6]|uniref:Family 43 glycosylhydrolase n=1 Tax=Halogeometricum salsisoli TaxID=2950536 RepID=A0ABU2GI92_9EURY|nr:family 43 glycosylhydrolase [Halogeometricum sp. S1BR25-6]MDS0299904.1 family 43 glycosylhydrolase [Halogeometricum sp. S1BR25-6]
MHRTVDRRAFLAAVAAVSGGCLDGATPEHSDATSARSGTGTSEDGEDAREGPNATYRNPVFEEVFADPTVVEADDAFYAYATYHPWGGARESSRLIPVARSTDLVNWSDAGAAFASMPDWRDADGLGLWAPDAARFGGRYVLYYSYARFGDPNPGIGVAVSPSPAGPFEDRGELLRSDGIGVPNSIDPCLVREGGTPFLFWGSKRGIYGVRLAPDGLSVADDPFQVAGDGVEAPFLVKRNGRYYFFGSRGTCCAGADSTYHVVVGRSESLRGPYRNREGTPLTEASGTTILRGDDAFAGPGHNAVVRDHAGDDWLLYHAYERSNPWTGNGDVPRRVPMLDRLDWRDGWPRVRSGTPSRTAPVPRAGGNTSGASRFRPETPRR